MANPPTSSSAERVKSLVNACMQLKSGHGLFLFSDHASLKQWEDVFRLPWQTGRPGQSTCLLLFYLKAGAPPNFLD